MKAFKSTPTKAATALDQPARITTESVRAYLADLSARGRSVATVRGYASRLRTLWEDLPPDKLVRRETLVDWQNKLLDRGTPLGASTSISPPPTVCWSTWGGGTCSWWDSWMRCPRFSQS